MNQNPFLAGAGIVLFWLASALPIQAQDGRSATLSAPNCIIQVSEPLAAALGAQVIDRVSPVRDVILKADIYGTGHTVGKVAVEFVPCADMAVLDLVMTGRTNSCTTGYRGPVQVHNTGVVDLCARKRVCIDADGIHFCPAWATDRLYSTLQCITTSFENPVLDRAVRKMALRKYYKNEDLATRISESHIAGWTQDDFNKDADPQLLAANLRDARHETITDCCRGECRGPASLVTFRPEREPAWQ